MVGRNELSTTCKHLRAVVLDWAGTTIDYGSRAPALVFQEVFRRRGVEISIADAREPMGMAKREHIAAITEFSHVQSMWKEAHGRAPLESDIDAMYFDFLPLQKEVLSEHCLLIPGAKEAVEECRALGLRIGSSTGYTHELMEIVGAEAATQGYSPDCVLCAEDAPKGRPAPFLLFEAAKRFEIYPMHRFVKVDDTSVGIEAGRNAGCWTVGVTKTGNCVGLSEAELNEMDQTEVLERCRAAENRLFEAGAHEMIQSVSELPKRILEIDARAAAGERP